MTVNEKKILTLISKYGPLTKRQLAEKSGVSWATVVKMVARLESAGYLVFAGLSKRKNVQGKDSSVFDLSETNPLSIGIDIEYSATHLLLTNLKNQILDTETCRTPRLNTIADIEKFVAEQIERFIDAAHLNADNLAGVGVVLPAFLVKTNTNLFSALSRSFEGRFPFPVMVDDVIRAYTLYKERQLFSAGNFIILTIRSGIGVGISLGGHLYRGDENLAGELSHVVVEKNGRICPRCGKRGCLETLVNEKILLDKYRKIPSSGRIPVGKVSEELSDLFARASQGQKPALSIVQEAADHLARGLGMLLHILDIRRVYLAGHFGPHGDVLIKEIEGLNARYLSRMISYEIFYEPLEDYGFTSGASLLVLRRYCDYDFD
jgi:predicted NBD/HSP70 family sugar kinase